MWLHATGGHSVEVFKSGRKYGTLLTSAHGCSQQFGTLWTHDKAIVHMAEVNM